MWTRCKRAQVKGGRTGQKRKTHPRDGWPGNCVASSLEGIFERHEGEDAASLYMQQPHCMLQDCEKMPPHLVSHICSWAGPWGWVQEEVKNGLYIYRILQTCWGWLKSFAWISGHSCKEKLFSGTFTDLWSCIHCSRNYTTSKISYLLPPFRWNPDVSVPCPAWKGPSSSQNSSQVSMLGRGLSQQPPCPWALPCTGTFKLLPKFSAWSVKGTEIADFFHVCFQGLSTNFPSPFFFPLHCTSDGSIWIEENYLLTTTQVVVHFKVSGFISHGRPCKSLLGIIFNSNQ